MNTIIIKKDRLRNSIITVFFSLIFKVILDSCCIFLVDDIFADNFNFEIIPGRMIESYLLICLASALIGYIFHDSNRPSRIVFYIYFVFLIIPMLSIYGLRTEVSSRIFVYMVLVGFIVSVLISQNVYRIMIPLISSEFLLIFFSLCVLSSIYVYGSLVHSGGLSRFNINLYKVYEVRSQLSYHEYPLMGYLLLWQAHFINMIFLVVGFFKRSRLMVLLVILAQFILFGMTNFKSFLFAPLLVSFLYFFSNRSFFLCWLLIGASFAVLFSWFIYYGFGEVMVPSIFIRRLFLIPADIHFWYYDFFSQQQNPYVMLSNSFLSPFFNYPYDMPVTKVISWEYLGRDGGPNVGYLGDAYAHFGFFGIISFSCVLGIFLYLLDNATSSLPSAFVVSTIAIPSMSLVNSALFTTFLTHGFLIALLSLWVLSGWLNNPISFLTAFDQIVVQLKGHRN